MACPLPKSVRIMLPLLPALLLAGCGGSSQGVSSGGQPPKNDVPLAAMAAAGDPHQTPAAAANQVVIDNFAFQPARLTVVAGTKVTWLNRDDVPHTATSTTKPREFDSGALDTDDQFSHVFSKPGTYEYFCAVHPHMTGRIVVK